MDEYERMIQRHQRRLGPTEVSHRNAQRQIEQRRMWGDLAPGQISLNQPWNRD